MKKKSIIKSCLLGAALLLGSGYAIINSKEVTINGTVSSENRDINVEISTPETNSFHLACEGDICTLTQDENTVFDQPYESTQVYLDFKNNESDIGAHVKIEILSVSSSYYLIYFGGQDEDVTTLEFDVGIEADSMEQKVIIVYLKDMPITEAESNCTFVLKVTISPVKITN